MQRILLIEDHLELAKLIKNYMKKHQFDVDILAHANRLDVAQTEINYQLIICDLNLPGRDGFEILSLVRDQFSGPIIMLTASALDSHHIHGLSLGADDYLIKPISPELLLAKVKSHLKHVTPNQPAPQTRIGSLTLIASEKTAHIKGNNLTLTPTEFALLSLFVNHFQQILSREFLFKNTLGYEYDGLTRTIDGRIVRLRRKLEKATNQPFALKTIWGKGYIFTSTADEPC